MPTLEPSATTTESTTAGVRRRAVQVRKARSDDAAAIAALGAHVFSATFGHSVSPDELQAYLDKDYATASIAADLEDPHKDTLVGVDENDRLVGFALLTRNSVEPCVESLESTVELQRIYVDTAAHGKGVGGLLARAVEKLAREQGFRNMWLGVWEENAVAQKAYEKWGYKKVGTHDFVVGTVVQTDWIMAKAL
ncbi:acyl-n-acyltransferase protein [Diplodia corticola]|uniref:Acyl-n-acyltransferase protein n=1 Tax=Diplodia corticola TaxID=236234 RepID=A0A1J9RDQ2_9PEZI|nr:acyl-n-acyltransferase protein [Diplodia corticola]OJD38569.1 acyl-n-acyltransferase protein [Diplodia corticola]